MDDGTDALDGTAAVTPPATTPMDTTDVAPPAAIAPPGAAMDTTDAATSGTIDPQATPQAPTPGAVTPPQPSATARLLGGLMDVLVDPHTSSVVRDDQGVRHVVAGVPLTRGQQIGHLLATALQGAATAESAPAGPNKTGRGAAMAVTQQINQAKEQAQAQNNQADTDFATKEQAQMQAINYQLLQRKVATAALDDRLHTTKANEDTVTFTNGLIDREKNLGSYDLGTVKTAGQIASVISALPDWEQHLYEKNTLMPIPIFDANGQPQGLQLYLRKQDPKSMPSPPDVQVPKWVPGKPGQPPTTVYFTPTNASVGDIDNYNAKYLNDESAYRTNEAKLKDEAAQTVQRTAEATKNLAQAAEARATAANQYATAEKTRREAAVLGTDGDGAANMTHDQIVKGMLDGSVDITKAVGIFKQPMARAGFIAEAKAADPNWTMQKYDNMRKMRDDLATGKMGDQVQSFQTFTGHAMGLVDAIDTLRNTNAKFLNVPINKLKKDAAGSTAIAAVIPQVEAVRNEFQNFLANHALQKSEIERGEQMIDENQGPAAMQGAVKSFMTIALTKLGAVNYRYKRQMNGQDIPALLDQNSADAIKNMGLGAYAVHALNLNPAAQPAATPGVAAPAAATPAAQPIAPQHLAPEHQAAVAAGVPPGAQPGYSGGNIVGYQDAQGWHPIGAAK